MAQGLNNREIARTLGVTHQCVERHASAIFAKLKAKSRLQVVLWYLRMKAYNGTCPVCKREALEKRSFDHEVTKVSLPERELVEQD